MASLNKIILIGNLTRDPESGNTQNSNYCKFGLAVNRDYKDASGQYPSDFFNVICWGKIAEICANNLSKGRNVYIEGSMYSSKWTDQETGKERTSWDVKANIVKFLDKKSSFDSNNSNDNQSNSYYGGGDEEVPF
jgi:single-strand DNA-binding protein